MKDEIFTSAFTDVGTHTVLSDSSPTKLGNQPNTQTPTFPASRTRIQLLRPSITKEKNSLNSKGHPLPEPELPTPLWNADLILPHEQVVSIAIDNTSVFIPGGGPPQFGFRRTDFIAANNGVHDQALFDELETAFCELIPNQSNRSCLLICVDRYHAHQFVFCIRLGSRPSLPRHADDRCSGQQPRICRAACV